MLHPLTVVYLCSSAPGGATLQEMEYGLADAFDLFCRKTFSFDLPASFPSLKLVHVSSPEKLVSLLFKAQEDGRRLLTEEAKYCALFLIDGEMLQEKAAIEGVPLPKWFLQYFPAIPKILLSGSPTRKKDLPSRRWIARPREIFLSAGGHIARIERIFEYFWTPHFWKALHTYVSSKSGTNWHTPGHNGGKAFEKSSFFNGFYDAFGSLSFRADLSVSVEPLGDLSSPQSNTPLSAAQRLGSIVFGTEETHFVTNGTSTSNKAMLMTLLKPGEVVLVDRNCHKSVHHAIVISGAVPRYLPARYNSLYGVWQPVPPEDLEREISRDCPPGMKPRMLILTTCTYEGILYPVWEIGRLCEEAGMLFYADEAWAPYLQFHPFYTFKDPASGAKRYCAVGEAEGAHFSVQSTHKALCAFSQASMIHVSRRFRRLLEEDSSPKFRWLRERFALGRTGSYGKFAHVLHEFLRYWHSTSPHYPMLATLDIAEIQMRLEGMKILEERLQWVASFKKRVAALAGAPEGDCFPGLGEIAPGNGTLSKAGYMHDPLKMLLSFKSPQCRKLFEAALLKSKIRWEKSSPSTILFLVTAGSQEEHFEYLHRVCLSHRELIGKPQSASSLPYIENAASLQAEILPRDAALCDGELLPIEKSIGRICGQMIVPYPPGIPVFLPGLRISKEMVEMVKDIIAKEGAGAVHGIFEKGKKYYVEVLAADEERRAAKIDPL